MAWLAYELAPAFDPLPLRRRGGVRYRRNSAQAIRRRPAEHDRQGGIGVSLMPIYALPTREGFGSRLLKRVLTVQTGADVKIDFDPDGLRVTVAPSSST